MHEARGLTQTHVLISACTHSHFDRDDTSDRLRQVYTVILYLTDDADSTAFPTFKAEDFAVPEFVTEDESTVSNAAAMRVTVQRGCLEKENFTRWPVRVGDMALFTQATMHFGTQNTVTQERHALFSVLTPFEGKRQDDYQIFRSAHATAAAVSRMFSS